MLSIVLALSLAANALPQPKTSCDLMRCMDGFVCNPATVACEPVPVFSSACKQEKLCTQACVAGHACKTTPFNAVTGECATATCAPIANCNGQKKLCNMACRDGFKCGFTQGTLFECPRAVCVTADL
ncbi:hypothetical protein HDV03_005463 [Kappamyces sp. JEL0829]|nr:hypothetical protein HDV03_005463 [Kappamyces sp. JEL0829]